MEWLGANWFFIFLLVCCVGMHLFGHSHHSNHSSDVNHKDH